MRPGSIRTTKLPWLLAAVSTLATLCAAADNSQPAPAPPQDPAAVLKPIRATKIILVGDSTVAVQVGWGGSFCAEHVTSFAACVNLARGPSW